MSYQPRPGDLLPDYLTEHRHAALGDSDAVPLGTLRRCSCGRWFVAVDIYAGDWSPLSTWRPVRWWRWRCRRRLREAAARPTPPVRTTQEKA